MEAPERARKLLTRSTRSGAWLMVTSLQARSRRNQGHKPRVQASSPSLQALKFFFQGTSAQAPDPGYRQQGQKYFFYV